MQSPDSQLVVARFFEALQRLIAHKVIRGKKTFTDMYNINRWNLNTQEADHSRDIIQLCWFTYLVRDFKVSPQWLLTGAGDFYIKGWDAVSVRESVLNLRKTSHSQAQEKEVSDN